ncbi:hypothetical protein DW083_19825 [Parabacteroides sp. AF48-14]|uniref:hypothetical protein n=1 Tax=Parabacteroides sp. AF48-14 TaxID=2292052 RepID=UPI000EFF0330|nr:hypothetical protein [Parabacteroides sp. AF48-14]RHO65977.1 hypothetical protein DW083_19825 [Parabacteroides sp. AF48-14]
MEIKIRGVDYTLRYTARGLFIYEQIVGVPFSPDKLLNEYTLMYSMILANNRHFSMLFDEFIDVCDDEPTLFSDFRKWLVRELKQKSQLMQIEDIEAQEDEVKKN